MDAHDRTFFLVSSPDVLPMSADKFRCSPGKRVFRLFGDEGGASGVVYEKFQSGFSDSGLSLRGRMEKE